LDGIRDAWSWMVCLMGNHNSHVPFTGKLFTALFCDVSSGRSPSVKMSLRRDLQTILTRLSCEGMSFVTDVLPSLGRAIGFFRDQAVRPSSWFQEEERYVSPCIFAGFDA
jgi:hypothetical protein